MKKIARRMIFAVILVLALAAGICVFTVQYFCKANDWVTFPGNPHLYAGANLNCGIVTDRDGQMLMDTTQGLVFSEDSATRMAFLHLLGDRDGFISAPLIGNFSGQMIGYNKWNGLYKTEIGNANARLTLSAAVQKTALEAMNGRNGTVGVYNYKTGEILCALSTPTYDPDNVPNIADDTSDAYDAVYVNRFFRLTYTPGSIFKILTSVAAIEQIPDIYQQKFQCEGSCIIGGQNVVCEGVHHETDFSEGLAHSCNCTFGSIASQLGTKTLQKYADKAGLTSAFSCDGYRVRKGEVDLSHADEGDLAWAGIGQYSDSVSPYAFMRYMGILGGGGEAAEPHLMQSITVGENTVYEAQTGTTGRIVTEEAAKKIATMLHYNVVTIYGTSQFPNLYVCAKSGTAEIEGQTANAMFAGFIRDDEYPLAFIVFVEKAGAGSAVAAPIAGKVLNACVTEMQK